MQKLFVPIILKNAFLLLYTLHINRSSKFYTILSKLIGLRTNKSFSILFFRYKFVDIYKKIIGPKILLIELTMKEAG
ncbi:hypothetical protein BSG1_06726 [Bacillus sp. SG-1]|nr:hypothetical protein BSG1_06726 [Bacillus sp. SG-1]